MAQQQRRARRGGAARGIRLLAGLGLLGAAAPALAGGPLLLPYPSRFGVFPAGTFDDSGRRIGQSELSMLQEDSGRIRIEVATEIEGGGSNRASALLEPLPAENGVRILREQSESHDESGVSLGIMEIDHVKGVAHCGRPAGVEPPPPVPLPDADRVVNVPLPLLFQELVRGDEKRVDFQFLVCRDDPKIYTMRARRGERRRDADGRPVVEVTYGPHFGRMVSMLAGSLLPRLSFWFDEGGGGYLAHRMPLFSKGPEVVVVRDGFAPATVLSPAEP